MTTKTPPNPLAIEEKTIDVLWDEHEAARLEAANQRAIAGRIDMELERRALIERPDFTVETGGSVVLVGDRVSLAMTYSRDYEYSEDVIAELPALTQDTETGPAPLTAAEYGELVQWKPKVSGTAFNSLTKRGGRLGEVLARMRTLKLDARPSFAPKERKV